MQILGYGIAPHLSKGMGMIDTVLLEEKSVEVSAGILYDVRVAVAVHVIIGTP